MRLRPVQGRQQAAGGFEVSRVEALAELRIDRLQRASVLSLAAVGQERRQIPRRAQFSSVRPLATAPLRRLHEASLRFACAGIRHRQQKPSFHAQKFRHITEIAVPIDLSDGVLDQRDGLGQLAGCR
jgi:hypothetical protein